MAIACTWDEVSKWETPQKSVLRMEMVNIPNGKYVFYILDLDSKRMTEVVANFQDEVCSIILNTPKGTRVTYHTIKLDSPTLIGINHGVTE